MMADSDYSGSRKPLERAPCSRFMNTLADDYFQPEQPSFEGSYAWCVKLAKLNGFEIPDKSKAARYLLTMADERNHLRLQEVDEPAEGLCPILASACEKWLVAEKARLGQHRAQLLSAPRSACALSGQEVDERLADAIRAAGVAAFRVKHDGPDDEFQRVNARGGVLQRLYLLVVHALHLLRLQKPKQANDPTQDKPAKEAA